MKLKIFAVAGWMIASMVAQVEAGAVFNPVNSQPFRNASYSFGNIFTVGGQNLTVTALGAYDDLGDGFVTDGGISVGLYNESTQQLLASTSIQSTDVLSGEYRYSNVSPLTLLSGQQYRVVAVNRDDNYNISTSYSVNPLVTYDGYAYQPSTSLTFSNAITGSGRIWMANLDVIVAPVPEPTSIAMWGLGALGLTYARRKRRQMQLAGC